MKSNDIHIPPEAVEAAARTIAIYRNGDDKWWTLFMRQSEAAIRAMLEAWPGMNEENRNGFSFSPLPHGTAFRYTVIILPLPTENPDAEA